MHNNFFIGLLTCALVTLGGGCFSLKEKFSTKSGELQEDGSIEAMQVITEIDVVATMDYILRGLATAS